MTGKHSTASAFHVHLTRHHKFTSNQAKDVAMLTRVVATKNKKWSQVCHVNEDYTWVLKDSPYLEVYRLGKHKLTPDEADEVMVTSSDTAPI